MGVIANQAPTFYTATTGNRQPVAAGLSGIVTGCRCVGSGSSVELYSGTADTDPHIGGVSAGGANDGVMPLREGFMPEFTNGLFAVVVGTVELYTSGGAST